MREHMQYWFGHPINEDYVGTDGSYMVCHCGGILVPMSWKDGDIEVGAVWHEKNWEDRDDN